MHFRPTISECPGMRGLGTNLALELVAAVAPGCIAQLVGFQGPLALVESSPPPPRGLAA